MTNRITSLRGICLLSPSDLTKAVRRIETICPGWWWSISQKTDNLTISMGPGQNCPFAPDNQLALTKRGDEGFVITHVNPAATSFSMGQFVDQILTNLCKVRGITAEIDEVNIPQSEHLRHRRQSDDDLNKLDHSYNSLVRQIPDIERDGAYIFNEVYLGSCDFSADCSLRGIKSDGKEFDFSADLIDDNIANALEYALEDLTYDITNPE